MNTSRLFRTIAISVLGLATLAVTVVCSVGKPKDSYKPKEGYVPNSQTAIKIAVAVWEPIYGEKMIAGEKPYHALLDSNNVWHVYGSLPDDYALGGTAEAEIAKDDGRILSVIHGK
jgi:hypothetical protein